MSASAAGSARVDISRADSTSVEDMNHGPFWIEILSADQVGESAGGQVHSEQAT
jgi:hypothetical protein